MMMTKLLLRRSLLLFAACAFALGASVMARSQKPTEKPEAVDKPAAAEERPAEEMPAAGPSTGKKPKEKPVTEETAAEPAGRREKAKPEEDAKREEKIDREAVKAVTDMSKRLSELKNFSVEAEMSWEQVLENGEKIMSVEHVQADVLPPHGLRMERTSPGRERVLFYNGNEAVLWGPLTRYYTKMSFDGRIADLAKHLAETYAYELPLADLFLWGREKGDVEAIKAANFIGQDRIGDRICNHYAFRQENVDWQIWIDTEESGLPCRYAIVDLSDPARPVFEATVKIDPDVEFYDKRFTFEAPKDAAEIPITKAGEDAAERFKKKAGEKPEEQADQKPGDKAEEEQE